MVELLPRPVYLPAQRSITLAKTAKLDESKASHRSRHHWQRATKPNRRSESTQYSMRPSQFTSGKFKFTQSGLPIALSTAQKPSTRCAVRSRQIPTGNTPIACPPTVTIPSSVNEDLRNVVVQMQQWFEHEDQTRYELSNLQRVLTTWLEDSIEQLVADAFYHCCTGCTQYAFNRQGFQDALTHLNRQLKKARDRGKTR